MLTDFSKNLENWSSGAAVTCEEIGMMKLVAAFCTCPVNMAKKSTFWEQLFVPVHEKASAYMDLTKAILSVTGCVRFLSCRNVNYLTRNCLFQKIYLNKKFLHLWLLESLPP
jgi:hypothetical protein